MCTSAERRRLLCCPLHWFKFSFSVCASVSVYLSLSTYVSAFVCQKHYRKTDERIFKKFSLSVGHAMRKNLEQFSDVMFNLLDKGMFSLFWFGGAPVSVTNITENWWMDFHYIFDIGTTWHTAQSGKFIFFLEEFVGAIRVLWCPIWAGVDYFITDQTVTQSSN